MHIAKKDYGMIALALARFTYFGCEVVKRSTINRTDGTDMLNPHAMRYLKADMRGLFMDMSETEFELTWRSKCLNAIAAACRHLRCTRGKYLNYLFSAS